MTEDDSSDTTYNEIESISKYVATSKTTGYVKLRLAAREFPRDEEKVTTYSVAALKGE
jgi:hypothetical protein